MSNANDRQVGGTHYNTGDRPQHWDLVLMNGWDYFQGQITKYLMRWKVKHDTPEKKLEDLKKARHFLDKYIENYETFLPAGQPIQAEYTLEQMAVTIHAAPDVPNTPLLEKIVGTASNQWWTNEGFYGDNTELYKCRKCGSTVRQSGVPGQPHPPCAAKFLARPEALPQAR